MSTAHGTTPSTTPGPDRASTPPARRHTARDLAQIAAGASRLGEPVYLGLFGANPAEPYRTFRNLWTGCRELPLRLSGLLCALAYRTEELRG